MRLRIELQSLRWTDARTKPAMHARILIDNNLSIDQRNANIIGLHPLYRLVELIDIAREFYKEFAYLIGRNLSAKDVCSNIKVLCQSIGNWHMNGAFGKRQRQSLFH